jgi:hypothetical protein
MNYWVKLGLCILVLVTFALTQFIPPPVSNVERGMHDVVSGLATMLAPFALIGMLVLLISGIKGEREKTAKNEQQDGPGVTPVAVPTVNAGKKKRSELITAFMFLWAFGLGWTAWRNFSPKTQMSKAPQWEDKTIAPRVAVLRQKLSAIGARPVPTVDDYVANTLETWPIIEEAKGLVRQQMVMIARFKRAYPSDSRDARMADYMMRLTEKDEQFMYLLGDEVDCARTIKSLAPEKRLAYYNAHIPPIKDKEAQLAKDFFAITNDAKANGIPLPPL